MDLSVVILLSLVSIVNGFNPMSHCLLFLEKCVTRCPRLMHPYHTRCDRDTITQRTCDYPEVYNLGYTCGWSRCDCNGDLVLFEDEGICVELEDCPEWKFKVRNRKRKHHGPRVHKKLHLPRREPDDPMMNSK